MRIMPFYGHNDSLIHNLIVVATTGEDSGRVLVLKGVEKKSGITHLVSCGRWMCSTPLETLAYVPFTSSQRRQTAKGLYLLAGGQNIVHLLRIEERLTRTAEGNDIDNSDNWLFDGQTSPGPSSELMNIQLIQKYF